MGKWNVVSEWKGCSQSGLKKWPWPSLSMFKSRYILYIGDISIPRTLTKLFPDVWTHNQCSSYKDSSTLGCLFQSGSLSFIHDVDVLKCIPGVD